MMLKKFMWSVFNNIGEGSLHHVLVGDIQCITLSHMFEDPVVNIQFGEHKLFIDI